MTEFFQSWGMSHDWAWFVATICGILLIVALFSVFSGSISALFWPDVYNQYGSNRLAIAEASLMAGLGRAALPFFGAALLWRIDQHWPIAKAGDTE